MFRQCYEYHQPLWLQVAELKLMKTLLVEPHPNVVRLLGCCTAASDKEPTYLIMEYVAKGKLQEFLRRYASIIITRS